MGKDDNKTILIDYSDHTWIDPDYAKDPDKLTMVLANILVFFRRSPFFTSDENFINFVKFIIEDLNKNPEREHRVINHYHNDYLNEDYFLGCPDNYTFLDNEMAAFSRLSKKEFEGLIKGLNIVFPDMKHFSTESEEFKALATKFDELIANNKCQICNEKMRAKQCNGVFFLGFQQFCPNICNEDHKSLWGNKQYLKLDDK